MLHTGRGEPMATIEQELLANPGFVSGHCLRAAPLVITCRDDARRELARTLDAAQAFIHRADERERRHLEAAAAWLENDLKRALHLYGVIVTDHPHDTLALRVAHFGDLQWSRTERLRDRVAARWSSTVTTRVRSMPSRTCWKCRGVPRKASAGSMPRRGTGPGAPATRLICGGTWRYTTSTSPM
jgi:hypothetical protein